MNLRSRLKSHPELHAGALNDILFILLFFFLIVSTLANPNVIKLSQPKSKSDTHNRNDIFHRHFFVGIYYNRRLFILFCENRLQSDL